MTGLNLVPHPSKEGYFQSKRDSRVYVNRNGDVIFHDGQILPIETDGEYHRTLGGHVHRHVAETFIPRPPHIPRNKRIVNHLDGIKTNNKASNLEWTDYRGNLLHAMLEGLNPMNTKILVKDLRTGEFTEFFSLQDTARFYGLNASEIFHALKPKFRGKVWKKYFGIIRFGEEWPEYNLSDVGKTLNGYSKEILVHNTKTDEKIIYQGCFLLGQKTGVKQSTLSERLLRTAKKGLIWATEGDLRYTYVDNYDGDDLERISTVELSHKRPDLQDGFKKAWKVLVRNIQDNSETVYKSLRECCLDLNISFMFTQKKLAEKRIRIVEKWEISYLNA